MYTKMIEYTCIITCIIYRKCRNFRLALIPQNCFKNWIKINSRVKNSCLHKTWYKLINVHMMNFVGLNLQCRSCHKYSVNFYTSNFSAFTVHAQYSMLLPHNTPYTMCVHAHTVCVCVCVTVYVVTSYMWMETYTTFLILTFSCTMYSTLVRHTHDTNSILLYKQQ